MSDNGQCELSDQYLEAQQWLIVFVSSLIYS